MVRAQARNLAGISDSSNIIMLQTKTRESVGELTTASGANCVTSSVMFLAAKAAFLLLIGQLKW